MFLWFHRLLRGIAFAVALLIGVGIVSTATPAIAGHDHDDALQAVRDGEIRPLAEILNIVRDKLPGEVIRTELERKDGKWIYELRVADREGHLFDVHVDARSGEIKRTKKK
ncbi:MAG: PepSY domain-containing protein [Proteobacteria bacterium]|nr:PepSY domain-containing protein [Pseudomonadota bacterium]